MDSAFLRTVLIAGVMTAAGFGPALTQAPEPAPADTAATAASAWDATWVGGWEGGEGTQLVIAGGEVVGFFWGGDYLAIENSTSFADGSAVKFIYPGGEATLKGGRDGELLLKVHEKGREEIGFSLKRQ